MMENTVQTTASIAIARGIGAAFFSITERKQQCCELVVDVLVMLLPLHDDRIAAPVRVPMEKTLQTIASSASDRGSCGCCFRHMTKLGQGQGQPFSFLLREPNNVST